MISTIQHAIYGEITYDENFWTGKKVITIDGLPLVKEKKNVYLYNKGEEQIRILVKGSFLTGAKLVMGQEILEVTKPATWYEMACSVAIFVFITVWGNSETLCSMVPIIGGAIGGGVSGAMAIVNLLAMRSVKHIGVKLAVFLGMLVATMGICFALAMVFLTLLAQTV